MKRKEKSCGNIHGHCVCGAVEIVIKEYGNFVYTSIATPAAA
jgi:hypothetical protein